MKIHNLRDKSHHEVYDQTQTDESIGDGDVLLLSGGGIGVLIGAYPTIIHGTSDVLHQLNDGVSLDDLDDGRYSDSLNRVRLLRDN